MGSLRQTLRHQFQTRLPGLWDRYVALRTRQKLAPLIAVDKAVVDKLGTTIQRGPFEGMQHVGHRPNGGVANKIIGSYEEELHGTLTGLADRAYTRVINIGCAEGYYAIGLARVLPGAMIYAYDIDRDATRVCEEMAAANGVGERVITRGLCDHAELEATIDANTLIFIDCEGCELELLDPKLAPKLLEADVLAEIHDFVNPDISRTVRERFSATHDITEMQSRPRDPDAYEAIRYLSPEQRKIAVHERSESNCWFFMARKPAAG